MMMIGLLPLLLYGSISIVSTSLILKDETINSNKQFVYQREQYIDLVMSDVESLIANLSGIDDLTNALNESQSNSTYDKLTTQAEIGYILSGYTNLKGLISIDVFSEKDIHFHVGETLNASNINTDLKDRLFKEAAVSKEFVHWSGIEKSINNDSQFKLSVIAAKIINAKGDPTQNDNAKGLMVISYNPENFSESLVKYKNEGGYSLIFDDKNRIIYHPQKEYIGKTLSDDISTRFTELEGSFEEKIAGKNMLVVYKKTKKGGWTIASNIQMSDIYSKSIATVIVFSILIIFCILSIIAFGFKVSKSIVLPIRKVTETFRMLQDGQIESPIKFNTKSQDEIGQLAALFDSFIDAREDITLQKKLEKELLQALEKLKNTQMQMIQQEKLAGIGQLAAGVAHEINNPLGFVSSNINTISKYIGKYEKVMDEVQKVKQEGSIEKENSLLRVEQIWKEVRIDRVRNDMKSILEDTEEGITRIANIVNGLKSFSRINKTEEKHMFNLNEGIKTTLIVANNELKYSCIVNYIPGGISDVYVNGGQINQVILNIIINAVYAIKQKFDKEIGLIVIKTYEENGMVALSIEDNGCGMEGKTMQKIFEPFFTTKPVGQGTGLGLGIAYDIISIKNSGEIIVESEVGKGTKFIISLPIHNPKPMEE